MISSAPKANSDAPTNVTDQPRKVIVKEETYCLSCGQKISALNFKNNDPHLSPYYHMFCDRCPLQWVACALCPSNKQPKLISHYEQSRAKKTICNLIIEQMRNHTKTFHPNLMCNSTNASPDGNNAPNIDCEAQSDI